MNLKASIKKNIAFQTIYQITNTCLPLITSPYLSRVLGASQLGVYSFTTSVLSYFMLFAMLGTYNHGTRSIASCGDNIDKRSKTFWSIYRLHSAINFICLCLYAVYLVFFCKENHVISAIQTIELFSCLLNIAWLYNGVEKIQFTATRSLVIRVLTFIFIMVFVKKSSDLWIYVLITASGTLASQLFLWINIRRLVNKEVISWKDSIKHLKPILMLFVPLLAMSVYHIMDKMMLGLISNYEQSGYYYNADKIVNIIVEVVAGISTVMLPRMTALISQGKEEESNNLFSLSLEGTVLAGIAVSFGIAAIANEFEPVFFGPGYEECIKLTILLAPVIIIKSFSITARYQFLIPRHRERDYINSTIIGAAINIVMNYLFIPRLGATGAVIGTLIAELTACIVQFIVVGKLIDLKQTLRRIFVYLLFGIVMFLTVRMIAGIQISNIYLGIIIEIMAGAFMFIGMCIVFWNISNTPIKDILLGGLCGGVKKRF